MSLFSAEHLRSVALDPNTPGALEAPPAAPGFTRILLLAGAQLADFAVIAASGLAIYYAHVIKQIGSQPIYYLLSFGVALISSVAFYLLQSYGVPTLRRPMIQLFRMSGAWTFIFAALIALVFFAKLD